MKTIDFNKTILCLLPWVLVGCSSPATPDEIRVAIQKCPNVERAINIELMPVCVGTLTKKCFEADPLTNRKLKSLLKDCLKEASINADPKSDRNVVASQRAALESQNEGSSKSVHKQFEEAQSYLHADAEGAAQ